MATLGRAVVAWKLGAGSLVQKRQSGVGRLIAGRTLSSPLYHDGDTVPLPNAAPVTIEFEIAYVLESRVPTFPSPGAKTSTRRSS